MTSREQSVQIKSSKLQSCKIKRYNQLAEVQTKDSVEIQEKATLNTTIPVEKHIVVKDKSWKRNLWRSMIKFLPCIIATILYFISLVGCYDDFYICLKKYPPKAMFYGFLLLSFCGLLYSIQVYMFFFTQINVIYIIVEILVISFMCFVYDTGTDLISHGGYNRVILLGSIILWMLAIPLFLLMYILFRKRPYITLACILIISLVSIGLYHHIINRSCREWPLGFKDTRINNSQYTQCMILSPKVCYFFIFNGFFDASKLLHINCNSQNLTLTSKDMNSTAYMNILPYLKDPFAKYLGYPRTENYNLTSQLVHEKIHKSIINGIINMENENETISHPNIEVTVNFYSNPPKVNISILPDQKLITQRQNIFFHKKNRPIFKNVLHLFIDSVSRANFRVKLKSFWSWMESKYSQSLNPREDFSSGEKVKYESFQFFKYHALGRYTRGNMVPSLFGTYSREDAKQGIYFLKYFKEAGYITGSSLDFCSKEFFEIEDKEMSNLSWDTYDHEMFSIFCDPNYTPYNEPYSIMNGPNSILKRCLFNNYTVNYSLEYLSKFWEVYKDYPKFFRLGIIDAHEGTYESIKYDDELITNFFEDFLKRGYLEDTLFIIQSDHGNAQPGPYSLLHLDDFFTELSLPGLYLILPTNVDNYSQLRMGMKLNEQKLITPFTVYNSLLYILNNGSIPYTEYENYTLFSYDIPDRGCNKFDIESSLCRCAYR